LRPIVDDPDPVSERRKEKTVLIFDKPGGGIQIEII
jgi:hypothetical protein